MTSSQVISSPQVLDSESKARGNGVSMIQRSPSWWAGTSIPTSSMNGTTWPIQSWRSSSLDLPLKTYSSWMPCFLRAAGSPNPSSVRMNIQSSEAWSLRFSSGSAASFFTQVRPWRRWKVSSLSTLASARFHGPKVEDVCTSESSTKPAWSYSAFASTISYQESSGTSNAYGYLKALGSRS